MGLVPPQLLLPRVKMALGFHTPTKDNEQPDYSVIKDYEQPRAEYPFPPEPDENAPLWEIKDGIFVSRQEGA